MHRPSWAHHNPDSVRICSGKKRLLLVGLIAGESHAYNARLRRVRPPAENAELPLESWRRRKIA
jgi:hypothetical protein